MHGDLINTGIRMEILFGVFGWIAPHLGLALYHGLQVGAGVVDPDYRGEIQVLLFNSSMQTFHIQAGDKIAQMIFEKINIPLINEVRQLSPSARGIKGFGSTGQQ
jgi:dUTP pyrophosphatase